MLPAQLQFVYIDNSEIGKNNENKGIILYMITFLDQLLNTIYTLRRTLSYSKRIFQFNFS